MALPYTLDLANSSGTTASTARVWWGALPSDRTASGLADAAVRIATVNIEGFLQALDIAVGTLQNNIFISGATGQDLTAELEGARLLIQNSDGSVTFWQGVLADADHDGDEPYDTNATPEQVVAVHGYVGTLRLRFEEPFNAYELTPAFAGSAGPGTFTATLAHNEVAETIELTPAFAGSAGPGAFTATLAHNEVAETIELAPAFAGSAGPGVLTIAELVHFMGNEYELAPAFAGSAGPGLLAATLIRRVPVHHVLAPAFAGSAGPGALAAALAHNEAAEAILLRPAFAGSAGPGALAAALAHNEAAEAILLRPAFAGSAGPGALAAALAHNEAAEAIVLRPRFRGRAGPGALAVRLVRQSLTILYKETELALSPPSLADEPLRIVTCIEITHPEASGPIRLVDDGEDVTIGGVTYLAARFEAQTVGDGGTGAPRGQLSIGNVGRQVSRWIDDAGGGAGGQARVMDVLIVGGAGIVQWELTMDIASIATEENVSIGLGFDPLLGRPLVALRYDPETAPGLF